MKRHILALQLLRRYKGNTNLRKAVITHADADLICSLADCAYNILRGNVKLTPNNRKVLTKFRNNLRKLASKKVPIKRKRAVLQTGSGAFLTALLAPLASTFLPLLRQAFG